MNLEQLSKIIESDSNLNKYLRGIGKTSDNIQCITFENNKWLVFHYERGRKCCLKEFDSEILACEYFYKKIKDIEELKKKYMQEWKYVKPTNKNAVFEAEQKHNYKFSDEFIKFVLKYNGGRPQKNEFYLNDGSEKVFEKMLSFNKEDRDNIYMSFESKYINELVAVAKDPFGNLICFEKNTNNIVFWNHELDEIKYVTSKWENLINSLYVDKEKELKEVKDKVKKTDDGYKYNLLTVDIIIKKELTDVKIKYANKLVHYYLKNKQKINEHIYEAFKKYGLYVDEYSKEQIFESIGKPILEVSDVNWANITYLESKLDEHIITVEVANEFELGYVLTEG